MLRLHVLGRRLHRSVWLLAALPFLLVGVGSRLLVQRVGDLMVRSLLAASAVVSPVTEPAATREGARIRAASVVVGDALLTGNREAELYHVDRGRRGAGGHAPGSSGAHLFIPTERLMALTARELGAVRWARLQDGRGAGVCLSGVAGLGVGLADGDVVTSIDGRPTRNEDDATAAGMAAWASGEAAVHATLRRREQVVAVTVELPPRARP
jgi:hypothetical protein